MGTQHSTDASDPAERPPSAEERHYASLYQEMRRGSASPETSHEHSAESSVDDAVFKNRLVIFFGGPCIEFGQLLYDKLFGIEGEEAENGSEAGRVVQEASFIAALVNLRRASMKQAHHEVEKFYFSVFTKGEDHLSKKVLTQLVRVAATFAITTGTDLHEEAVITEDHPIILSLVSSAMLMGDQSTGELTLTQFTVWVGEHCPHLLEGLQQWIMSLLKSRQATHHSMHYQLPTPNLEGQSEEDLHNLYVLMWALSTIAPPVYMGRTQLKGAEQSSGSHPVGGTWTPLYSSDRHGFSMNRLKHHCFDYHDPSIMLLSCRDKEGLGYLFAICTDREWRDGTYFWGGDLFCFIELQPTFKMIKSGPQLVSLNEKARGFPTGLRVMEDTQYKHCLLCVESSLDTAVLNESIPLTVRRIELWGCGGQEAAESQRRMREWDKKEVLRRQKINRAQLISTWEDSPDRYLLELAGVRTNNPKEQQLQ